MTTRISTQSIVAIALAGGVFWGGFSAEPAAANECILGCRVAQQSECGRKALRDGRRSCREACKELRGPARGECVHGCAGQSRTTRDNCRQIAQDCRRGCSEHPDPCKDACGVKARACFLDARDARVDCRRDCRNLAAMDATKCREENPDPGSCLEMVGEDRGDCLDRCPEVNGGGIEQCSEDFGACMRDCALEEPDEKEPSGEVEE